MGSSNRVMEIVIDKNNYKWIRYNGTVGVNAGLAVYNDNRTTLEPNDDDYKTLNNNKGSGELPDIQVNCLAVDHDGEIWVGTAKGLCVFYSPGNIFSANPSDAKQVLIGEGDNLGYLLGDEAITAIFVDGGNRKWIGSRSGLWLVSPDGREIIHNFNVDNSPLLSNNIRQLGIVEETGELFISTDKGIISFRTDASTGEDKHGDVKVFPNPVRPDYRGKITIQGLPEEAYVKITDIAGNLVYETRSNGGTASWDGNNFEGRRASSGVYLVFSANPDASDTFVSKILFISK
jgi:ligand-binding sensor domain-containing protein